MRLRHKPNMPHALARQSHLSGAFVTRVSVHQRRHVHTVVVYNKAMANPVATGLGTALAQLQDEECVYMDYNATTPIFPEVDKMALCSTFIKHTAACPCDHYTLL